MSLNYCLLCNSTVRSNLYNIDEHYTSYLKLPFRTTLENVLDKRIHLELNFKICSKCVKLLNEVDLAENNYKLIKNKFIKHCSILSNTTSNLQDKKVKCENTEPSTNESIHYNCMNLVVNERSSASSKILSNSTRMKNQHSETVKVFISSECPEELETTSELRSHLISHKKEQPFICEICGKSYKHKSALKVHVGMHNGINPYVCMYCNKAFTQKGALRRHIRIHTGETPFQCDLCGKRFVHHTSFNVHLLSHSGKKLHKCTLCDMALFSGSHLKRHMRVHTGERNFVCNVCGRRFAERYNLVAHQKLLHNV